MEMFIAVALLVLAIVVGGLARLLPTREERRLAALRMAAIRAGLRVRRPLAAEREALGLRPGSCWYVLPTAPDAAAADEARVTLVLADGAWRRIEGEGPEPPVLPAGCQALVVEAAEARVAWDERGGEAELTAIGSALRELASRRVAGSLTSSRAFPPVP